MILFLSYFANKENKSQFNKCSENDRDKQTVSKLENDKIANGKSRMWSDWLKSINFYKVVRIINKMSN
jgi:hypothetical protein